MRCAVAIVSVLEILVPPITAIVGSSELVFVVLPNPGISVITIDTAIIISIAPRM